MLAADTSRARPVDLLSHGGAIDFNAIYNFAKIASDTYVGSSAIRDRHPGVSWIATPGHAHVLYFVKTDPDKRSQTIAVRGTVDDTNWQLDTDTKGVFDSQAGIVVHNGFHTVARLIYGDIKPHLRKEYQTYLTGHSLGGAVAAILGVYLRNDGYPVSEIYTFGQPKFTDAKGAILYRSLPLTRVVYQNDVVTMLPDEIDDASDRYAHFGTEVVLLSGPYYVLINQAQALQQSIGAFSRHFLRSSVPDHKMKWYMQGLEQKIEGAKAVAYEHRERYVTRHKRGSRTDDEPLKIRSNWNKRGVF